MAVVPTVKITFTGQTKIVGTKAGDQKNKTYEKN